MADVSILFLLVGDIILSGRFYIYVVLSQKCFLPHRAVTLYDALLGTGCFELRIDQCHGGCRCR